MKEAARTPTMGSPPPYGYTTRPSLPGTGTLRLSAHSLLNSMASVPVAFSATSRFGSNERGTSDDGGGAALRDSAGTAGARLSAVLLGASPDSSARTASSSGYLSGDGTGSFFTTPLQGRLRGSVALGFGELFVACVAASPHCASRQTKSQHCYYCTVRLHSVPHRTFRPRNIHDVDPERIHS